MTLVPSERRRDAALGVALFVAATVVSLAILRPFAVASVGPDAAAPVIDFQRLLAGQQLEGYLSQTSKPLLTLIYGPLQMLTGGWQAVVWATIGAFAACVVLAAAFARRLGGWVAAGFVATAFLLSPVFLADLVLAYALPWAILTWLIAALAVTRDRPRYDVAGVALMFGALARPETLALTASAIAVVIAAFVVARVTDRPGPSRRSWLLVVGLGAIPILSIHDFGLYGDPLFWLNTAQENSEGSGSVRSLTETMRFVYRHVRGLGWPLIALAAVGFAGLLVQRRWVGWLCLAMGVGSIAAFWVAVGARGTVLAGRYLAPIDLVMIVAAGVGLGLLAEFAVRRLRDPARIRWLAAAGAGAGVLVALLLAPNWLRQPIALERAERQIRLHENAQVAFAALRRELEPGIEWRGATVPDDAAPIVYIAPRLRAQGVVDLDLPLWAAEKMFGGALDPAAGRPPPGTFVYHDALDDKPNPRWAPFEVGSPTVTGQLRLVPVYVDAPKGIWVLKIEAASD